MRSEEKEYKGKRYPTYFKFKGKEYGTDLQRECHVNMRCRVTFETDATNDYFDRSIDPGICSVYILQGEDRSVADDYSVNLQNGIATLSLKLPQGKKVGEMVHAVCVVTDGTRAEPFESTFHIAIREAVEPFGSRGERKRPPSQEDGEDREIPAGLQIPKITDVKEEDWGRQDPPFDKYTALMVVNAGSSEYENGDPVRNVFDFYVNLDNLYLRTELKNSKVEPEILKARFRWGLVLIGLGLLQHETARNSKKAGKSDNKDIGGEDEESEGIEDQVAFVTSAIAPILLPMINSLGEIDIEDARGEDFSAEST